MGTTKINVSKVISLSRELNSIKGEITSVRNSTSRLQGQIDYEIRCKNNIDGRISNICHNLSTLENQLVAIRATVEKCATDYQNTDNKIRLKASKVEDFFVPAPTHNKATLSKKNKYLDEFDSDDRSWFAKFINNDLKKEGSKYFAEASKAGKFLGISSAGTASGSFLYWKTDIKNKASLGFKDGKWDIRSFGLSTKASATGALARGEVKGNWGLANGKASGEFLTGTISGESKATLWDDGKFNPSLMMKAKAEASALHGDAEGGIGNNQYGVKAKASGDLLYAEAEAEGGIGYIGKDKNGKDTYGASGKLGAMAGVAKGEITGEATLFGVDIDVTTKGHATSVGAEIGGKISTNGAKAKLDGAFGLGAGIEVSIDWTDAKWVGDSVDKIIDWTGDAIKKSANAVFDKSLEYIGDAVNVKNNIEHFLNK